MSNSNSKKTSRKLNLSIQTVHTMSPRANYNYSPTATCYSCSTDGCATLFFKK